MCGRFNIIDNPALRSLLATLNIDVSNHLLEQVEGMNIAPTETVGIIRNNVEDERRLAPAMWWFLLKAGTECPQADTRWSSFNARASRMFGSRLYQSAAKHQRCIVPASGYYEWVSQKGIRTPYYLEPADGAFAFAGLYREWRFEDEIVTTASIVTTESHPSLRWLHEKSTPLMLDERDYALWLDKDVKEESQLKELWTPQLPTDICVFPVDVAVNNARYKSAECVAPQGPVRLCRS